MSLCGHYLKSKSVALALTITLLPAGHAARASCTWGGTSALSMPSVTALRSSHDVLRNPVRAAADATGNLYVADAGAGRITARDAYGRLLSVKQELQGPLALAVDASGWIYVGEEGAGSVTVFSPDWKPQYKLGKGDGEFLLPNHITIDDSRHLAYVVDSYADEVRVYSGPMFVTAFGGRGTAEGQFDFPTGIFAGPGGEVFVADQNNDRVQVFDSYGSFLRCFGGNSFNRRFGRIQGITGDQTGRIYVADAFQGNIQVFDEQGAPLGKIGGFGEMTGELKLPSGMAIDRFNRMFIASSGNGRVEVFGLDAYTDPSVLTADVKVERSTLVRSRLARYLTMSIFIEIKGHNATEIVAMSVTANGVAADLKGVKIGDHDRDGIQDLMLRFNLEKILTTLPDGPAVVAVAGRLSDGTPFEGSVAVKVISVGGVR